LQLFKLLWLYCAHTIYIDFAEQSWVSGRAIAS